MSGSSRGAAAQAGAIVTDVTEEVFATVSDVRAAASSRLDVPRDGDRVVRREDVHALRDPVLDLLLAPGRAPVGLGVIVAPDVVDDEALCLEWWQCDPDLHGPTRLEPDLNAHSVGFYDYLAAPWFDVPRRTGRRHVVGPYVDVHGTDRYVLTFTEPVVVDGVFLGVAGADVPVARFESLLLRALGDLPADVVVAGAEDRVVMSTSSRWLVGSLLRPDAIGREGLPLPDLPWRLFAW